MDGHSNHKTVLFQNEVSGPRIQQSNTVMFIPRWGFTALPVPSTWEGAGVRGWHGSYQAKDGAHS